MRGTLANGERIQKGRQARGLTQEQLAVLAGLDVKTIRKAEQGKRVDIGSMARLAAALEVELPGLVKQDPDESPDDRALQIARRRVVERWVVAWDTQDMDALLALYHEQGVLHLPGAPRIPFGGTFRGRDEIRRVHEIAWATSRTLPQSPQQHSILVAQDTVVLHGPKSVCLPGGGVVQLSCTQLFTFDGALIVEHRVEYDTLRLCQLLGLPDPDDTSKS